MRNSANLDARKGYGRTRYVSAILVTGALALLVTLPGAAPPRRVSAQQVDPQRALYDSRFDQFSGAGRTALERRFGRKPALPNPAANAAGSSSGESTLSLLTVSDLVVNDVAADS